MVSVVTNKIIERINNCDGDLYTIKFDETKYRSGIELLSIIIRFIKEGDPNEIILFVIEIKKLNAKYIADKICSEIAVITCPTLLSLCNAGASVMSGKKEVYGNIYPIYLK